MRRVEDADGRQLTACSLGRTQDWKRAGAVSRRRTAAPALVYESHGLTDEEIGIAKGGVK